MRLQEKEEAEEMKLLPHKHDIISVLGVGGHWVTSHQDLQVSDCSIIMGSGTENINYDCYGNII